MSGELTESLDASLALRASEARLNEAQRLAKLGSWELDLVENVVAWSDEALRIFELEPGGPAPTFQTFLATVHPEDRERVGVAYMTAVADGKPYAVEHRVLTPGGRIKYVHERGQTFYDAAGRPVRSVGTVQDITELREAQDSLRRHDALLRSVIEAAPLAVCAIEADGRVVLAEGSGLARLAIDPAAVLGASAFDVFARVPGAIPSLRKALAGERISFETSFDEAWFDVTFVPLVSTTGEVERVIGAAVDITARRNAEIELGRSREIGVALLNAFPETAFLMDGQGRILAANEAAEADLGGSSASIVGSYAFDLVPGEVAERRFRWIAEVLATKRPVLAVDENGGRTFESRMYPVVGEDGNVIQVAVFGKDITEELQAQDQLRAIEAQLLRAQKLESVGRLAGGIAHDFNNLLTAILGFGQLVSDELDEGSAQKEDMREVINAAKRAAALTHQLLVFARRQVIEPREVDVNDSIRGMEQMLRRLIGEDIAVTLDCGTAPLVTLIDPGQLEQVIVNLAVNARDAMPRGGRLHIASHAVRLDDTGSVLDGLDPGDYAVIEVSDTGVGMAQEVLDHIFEPFFTTKEMGKGTGLGLATCYGIVEQAKGRIGVSSAPGSGTTFRIHLPACEVGDETLPSAPAGAVPSGALHSPSATILLVEDQDEVRGFVERVFRGAGYDVVAAETPIKALELAAKARKIDLVVSDLVMPLMDGVTMVEMLAAMIGQRPTVLMSGYAEETVTSRIHGKDHIQFLAKPVGRDVLLLAAATALRRWESRSRS